MALLPITQLETHDTGTDGVNAIICDNWRKIEAMFATGIFSTLVDGMTTVTYAATITFDITNSKRVNQCNLTGDATVAISEKAAGNWRILIFEADGTNRSLTWPGGVTWVNTALTSVAAGTTAMVIVVSRDTTDGGLVLFNASGAGGGGGGGSAPSWDDQDVTCLLATAAGDPITAAGITGVPVGRIDAFLNSQRWRIGDAVKTEGLYYSDDSGTTAKALTAITTGDIPYLGTAGAAVGGTTTGDLFSTCYNA